MCRPKGKKREGGGGRDRMVRVTQAMPVLAHLVWGSRMPEKNKREATQACGAPSVLPGPSKIWYLAFKIGERERGREPSVFKRGCNGV